MLAVAGVLILIIAAVIGVWVGTRGSTAQSSSHSHTAAPRMANHLMQALAKTNEIGNAKGRLPPASCHPQSTSVVTCSHPALSINTVRFHTYPTLNMMYDAYLAAVRALGQKPFRQDFADCSTDQVHGEVAWNHSHQHLKSYSVRQMRSARFPDDKAAGRVFCTYMNSQLYMVWTQNDGHLLGTLNGSPHDATWLWWHAVHHDIDIPGSPQMKM